MFPPALDLDTKAKEHFETKLEVMNRHGQNTAHNRWNDHKDWKYDLFIYLFLIKPLNAKSRL